MTADPYTRARTRISWVDSVSIRDIPASTDSSRISQSRLFDQVFLSREGKLLGRLMTTNYFSKEPTLVDFVMAPWPLKLWFSIDIRQADWDSRSSGEMLSQTKNVPKGFKGT